MSEGRQEPPPEPEGGQDDSPPDVGLLLTVVLLLLGDTDRYLAHFDGDPADLRLRIGAVSRAVRRFGEAHAL